MYFNCSLVGSFLGVMPALTKPLITVFVLSKVVVC